MLRGFIGLFSGILHFIAKLICAFLGLIEAFIRSLELLVVVLEFSLHLVKLGFGVVELNLPGLRPLVVLTKGLGSIVQSRPQRFDFALLSFDGFLQDLISGRECLDRVVVLLELALDQFHLAAKNLEGRLDFLKLRLELFFAFKTDFQSKVFSHSTHLLLFGMKKDDRLRSP